MAIALIAIVGSVAIVNGNRTIQNSEERNAINTIRQSIWQGATGASARGVITSLNKSGSVLTLENESTNTIIRTFELASNITLNVTDGELLRFLPQGEVDETSYNSLPSPVTLSTANKTYTVTISLIGETKVEAN